MKKYALRALFTNFVLPLPTALRDVSTHPLGFLRDLNCQKTFYLLDSCLKDTHLYPWTITTKKHLVYFTALEKVILEVAWPRQYAVMLTIYLTDTKWGKPIA